MAETVLKLDGLRKYTVAMSGLVVLALAIVASGEQIPHESTLSNNGTTHSIESNYLFDLFNLLGKKSDIHYHHVWPELEFGWRVIVGSVIGFFGAAFGSVGGVRGGGIFVPMLTLIIGFDPKTSTAISKCMITGAAGATIYYSLKLRHPSLDLPIIDYDLALLFQPMLLLGISIGAVLNVLFPEWMVTSLLIILFLAASIKAFFKGVETWKKETIIKEEATRRLASNDAGKEVAYKLIPGGPKNGSTFTNEVYKAKEVISTPQVKNYFTPRTFLAITIYLMRERGRFSPTRYFVEEVITGFDETDLHRSWIRAQPTRSPQERNTRLENMC